MPRPPAHVSGRFAAVVGCVIACGFLATVRAQTIPAFPGAEGAGAYAKGGRSGDVYHVTNTNASGAGSLAYGLTTGVPSAGRTIVFDVSGYAHISTELRVTAAKITIAGQTAPGDGFGLKDGTFRISGDDIVIRHLRFRAGHTADAIDLDSGSINSILDHCDAMFGGDENFSSFNSPPENMTFQWGLNAWGIESHSCGGLWDQNHVTCHHSLWAHNHTRNPKARPSVLDWTNNVTYDWDIGFIMGDSETPASWKANVRGNYFICPPGNVRTRALEKANLDRNGVPNFSIYVLNNLFDKDGDSALNGQDYGYGIASGSYATLPAAAVNTGLAGAIDSPLTAYKKIVSAAGALRLGVDANRPLRDEVGTILVNNLVTRTRKHISSVSQTGASNGGFGTLASAQAPADTDRDGMPDYWEGALGLSVAIDDHTGVLSAAQLTASFFPASTSAGYTWLEEYLHFLAIPHGVVAKRTATDGGANDTFLDVDLRKFASGFATAPVFYVTNISGGAVTTLNAADGRVLGDGHTVRFKPTLNTFGRGKFTFTVTDGADAWTQPCAILISASGIPRDLVWQGESALNQWNTTAQNWLGAGATTAFSGGDNVLFAELGSAPPVIDSVINAGTVVVDAAKYYVFDGTGSLSGTTLTKSGTGWLTLTNTGPNGFPGGAVINDGGVIAELNSALGTGPVTLAGGTLELRAQLANPLTVAGDVTLVSTGTRQFDGAISGAGALAVGVGSNATFTLAAAMTNFTGTVSLGASGGSPTAYLRLNSGTNANTGSSTALFDLGVSNATLLNRNGNTTINLGALTGGANTTLTGAGSSDAPSTYVVGANGMSTIFAGHITDNRSGAATTAITKTGAGTFTLSGTSSHTGATTVSAGALAVTGTLGNTAVTVAANATLSGAGTIGSATGGALTAATSSIISPGNAPGEAGTLRIGNGLNLSAATLPFDLSDTPAGANSDQILMNGGVLTYVAAPTFVFNFINEVLGNGTYLLVTGGTSLTGSGSPPHPSSNLPTNTRQSLALTRSAAGSTSYLRLVVAATANGSAPASLIWTGASSMWDLNTSASWSGGPTATFFNFDAVTFNDSGPGGTVSIPALVSPRLITVNLTSKAYTLDTGTTGGIGGGAKLIKDGTGTLTLSGGSSFTGGSTLRAGTVVLANALANQSGFGTGRIRFEGGTLTMAGHTGDQLVQYPAMPNDLEVPAGFTGTIDLTQRGPEAEEGIYPVLSGGLAGGGTLNLNVRYVRGDIYGNWSAFTGAINVTEVASNGEFRFGRDYSYWGFPQAALYLTNAITGQFTGNLAQGAGTTIEVGSLAGATGSRWNGGPVLGRSLTYRIGGRNTDATFAGTLAEQSVGSVSGFVITNGGSGYTSAPAVTLSGGGSSGATASAILTGGVVTEIKVANRGNFYTSAPTVTISGGGGAGAAATATLGVTITSFVKTGAGIWTLSGASDYHGGTTVEQGTLRISGTVKSGGANFEVLSGAALDLVGGTIVTSDLQVAGSASFTGRGAITGDLTNAGTVTCGAGALAITGDVVNNGTMRFTGGAALSATGHFVNNGVIDLLTGAPALPADLENNGVVIDSTSLGQVEASKSGNVVTLKVRGYTQHAYQLQRADSLVTPIWSNVGSPQVPLANGPLLTFMDNAATGVQRFYRITVSP